MKDKDPTQNVPVPDSVVIQREVPDLDHKAVELYERLMAGDIGVALIYSDSLLDTAKERVDIKKKELANHPTARLWLQYMWRQRGRVVRAPDLKSVGRGFKSRSDR